MLFQLVICIVLYGWLLIQTMGNSGSRSSLPQQTAGRRQPLAIQTVDCADAVADDCADDLKDPQSPSAAIPRNSFCSRLLARNGEVPSSCLIVNCTLLTQMHELVVTAHSFAHNQIEVICNM